MLDAREEATEALHQANQNLEARVRDRTANLDLAIRRLTAEIAERKKGEAELRRAKEEWERTKAGCGLKTTPTAAQRSIWHYPPVTRPLHESCQRDPLRRG